MRRTILLADDSPTIQRLITQTFADADFEVVSVTNGEAALRKFEEIRPNVVLADIYMPGKNGYEVCFYVKNHSVMSGTPVILLVGAFDAFDEETAKQAGAIASITKPFEPQALVDLVMSVTSGQPVSEATPDLKSEGTFETASETAMDGQPEFVAASVPARGNSEDSSFDHFAAPSSDSAPESAPETDLLGLEVLFRAGHPPGESTASVLTDADVERIVDRVIEKLSTQVIESVAWDIVPDITEKVLREELKRMA